MPLNGLILRKRNWPYPLKQGHMQLLKALLSKILCLCNRSHSVTLYFHNPKHTNRKEFPPVLTEFWERYIHILLHGQISSGFKKDSTGSCQKNCSKGAGFVEFIALKDSWRTDNSIHLVTCRPVPINMPTDSIKLLLTGSQLTRGLYLYTTRGGDPTPTN